MDLLEVGKIVNTHGLRGEVKVVPWTDYPEVFEDIDFVYVKKKSEYERLDVKGIKYQKNNLIVRFSQITDINMAEKYKNTCKVDLIMQPLIKKINDESANYTISYRKVYAMLRKTDPNINWANLKKRYVSKHGSAGYSRKKVVDSNPELRAKFEKAVNLVLMEEDKKHEDGRK